MRVLLSMEFRQPVPGYGSRVEGQPAIGSNLRMLDKALGKAGLRPLSDFVAPRAAAPAAGSDDGWFAAADGLAAVRAAASFLTNTPRALPWWDIAVRELGEVEAVLVAAEAEGVPFCFGLQR